MALCRRFHNNYSKCHCSKYNNSKNGNIKRKYDNLSDYLIKNQNFINITNIFAESVEKFTSQKCEFMHVHQIRVYSDNKSSNILPEGIHKDGYNVIGICIINIENIKDGFNIVYDNDYQELCNKQLCTGEFLIINDNKCYHNITDFFPIIDTKNAYRDIFVFTTIN